MPKAYAEIEEIVIKRFVMDEGLYDKTVNGLRSRMHCRTQKCTVFLN